MTLHLPGSRSLHMQLLLVVAVLLAAALALRAAPTAAAPPETVVDAATADLVERASAQAEDVELVRSEAVTWSDGCLGAAEPGEQCTQALVPGWALWLAVGDEAYRYHTDDTNIVRFGAGPLPLAEVAADPLPAEATPRAAGFEGELPAEGGVALVTWRGGAVEGLTEAAPGATSFWVTVDGRLVGYVAGAPGFVNEAFVSLYADGSIPAGTHMIVVLPRAVAADFDETGNLVIDTPGLPAGVWHLVYEAPGAPALTAALEFTAQSRCLLPTGVAVACDELEVGMRARVEGQELPDGTVRVQRVHLIETDATSTVIQVYFLDEERFATGDDPFIVGVERQVEPPAVATGAMEALFAGPTAQEMEAGLRLVASGATGAAVLQIADGVAQVQLLGGCDSMGATFTVANLIIPTLTRFDTIDWVKIYDPEGTTGQPDGPVHSIPACLEP